MDADRKPFPVVHTNFDENLAQFSPDGKWIAYRNLTSPAAMRSTSGLSPVQECKYKCLPMVALKCPMRGIDENVFSIARRRHALRS